MGSCGRSKGRKVNYKDLQTFKVFHSWENVSSYSVNLCVNASSYNSKVPSYGRQTSARLKVRLLST